MALQACRCLTLGFRIKYCFKQRLHARLKSQKVGACKETFSSQFCANLVRQYDHENFLCTLLLDGDKRRQVFALRAFNVEIAKVRPMISEDIIERMRLQFWNDSIEKCFDSSKSFVTDVPVLKELKYVVDNCKVTKMYLNRLVKARDRRPNVAFVTTKELEDYAEQTTSSLYYLLLEVFNIRDLNADHAASHLGKAQGIVNLLRSIPYQGRSSLANIPQETLMKHGVTQERIIRDAPNDKGVEECVFEIATLAHSHLEKSKKLQFQVPEDAKLLLLPAVAVERYLSRLRKAGFRVSDENVLKRDHLLPLYYWWHKIRTKY